MMAAARDALALSSVKMRRYSLAVTVLTSMETSDPRDLGVTVVTGGTCGAAGAPDAAMRAGWRGLFRSGSGQI